MSNRQGAASRKRAVPARESAAEAEAAPDAGETPAPVPVGRRRRRVEPTESTSDSVVFAIYTHAEERDRYRALAERLKVTHGELLTLLLDMTEELLESDRLEVRFRTVTVRKTMPEYVLKPSRTTDE